ncbi:MAG TPA: DUF1080 domain-containing protein [Bacteroidales bacterium]|jgi:hypothetical protein|nr:DUF1080 domain-containing protein [Bacteroidales bacterium]HOX73604.1 DUF1080 domain-containing protein [Bacteroidales bacterium]HPM87796.1 DUF1080 domain-containing protein [Bacteroidales bacterium]HQM69941.1 DUF1080 domain-containing protein [Bacteroidales bacterium]
MKTTPVRLTVLLLAIISGLSFSSCGRSKEKKNEAAKESSTVLFNGKDLNNWAFFLRDPSADASQVFTVQNDVIHITGNPFGYMRTKESYSDYTLHLEWRYPGELSNSGVFIHAQLPDTIWPKCIECQLKAGNAGDFVAMGGSDMNERTDKSVRVVAKLAESTEKAAGEWNTMEVTCISDNIDVFVNGVLMNKATGVTIKEGHICLQSEGKDIEFRNVYLTRLNK